MLVENEVDWRKYRGLSPAFVKRVRDKQMAVLDAECQSAKLALEKEQRRKLKLLKREAAEERYREQVRREMEQLRHAQAVPALSSQDPFAVRKLIDRVAAWHGYAIEDIIGKSRSAPIVVARYDAIVAVKKNYPGMSLPRLGRIFRRDHTSILYTLRVRGHR